MDKLKQKRATIRALTSKLLNKVTEVITDTEVEEEALEELLEQLNLKEDQLKVIDAEVLKGLTKPEEIEDDVIKSDEYVENIVIYKGKINRII